MRTLALADRVARFGPHSGDADVVAFHPGGNHLAVAAGGAVHIWDVASPAVACRLQSPQVHPAADRRFRKRQTHFV